MTRVPGRLRPAVIAVVVFGLVACEQAPPEVAAADVAESSMPDFGGWWDWEPAADDFPPQGPPQPLLHAPMKPEIVEFVQQLIAKVFDTSTAERPSDAELGIDVSGYCAPPRFGGFNGYYGMPIEILLPPGRALILDERGLVRRIDMSGAPLPTDIVESNAGTSVGRWEGSTLVVETVGLVSAMPFIGPFKFGKGIRVVERFRLAEPDVLEIALEMTAPEIFTAPFSRTYRYRRDRSHEFVEISACVENDRSLDLKTGQQRFDLTPPEGLPPPPAE